MTPARTTILPLLAALALTGACVSDDDELDTPRSVTFEGEAVDALLSEDPDALLLVDLGDDTIYHFDQTRMDLAWDHFMVEHPSMPAPMPMAEFAALLGLDTDWERWSLALPEDEGFRGPPRPLSQDQYDDGCWWSCHPQSQDCVLVCLGGD